MTQHTPTRYDLLGEYAHYIDEVASGDYVLYSDYQKLEQQRDELKTAWANAAADLEIMKLERDELLAAFEKYASHHNGCDWYGYGTDTPKDQFGECSCGLIDFAKAQGDKT